MPDPTPAPKPRIVVWESDACAGVISGRSCADCDADDCEHECHHAEPAPEGRPQDVPEPPDDRPTAEPGAVHRARTDGGTRALIARAMWSRDTVPSTAAQTGGYVWDFADRIAELAVPEIEQRAREQVAAEHVLITADDLAELLDYVVGDGDVRVVRNETLDRAFAALKATLEAALARGEGR